MVESVTILIVEDNELNLELATDVLESSGYRVLAARTAIEALELAKRAHPSLILMDIGLPGMGGLEAKARLSADPEIASIPVVALTSHAMAGDREQALAAGFTDYITKPIDIGTFAQTVGHILRSGVRK